MSRIRPDHMRRLYKLSMAPTKIWKALPGGDHNSSVLEDGYFETISEFIDDVAHGPGVKEYH
jgi:abhydrolase domain-containing protein 13